MKYIILLISLLQVSVFATCKANGKSWWLLLDSSGSMGNQYTTNTRAYEARSAITSLVDILDEEVPNYSAGLIIGSGGNVIVENNYNTREEILINITDRRKKGNPITSLESFYNIIKNDSVCHNVVILTDGVDGGTPSSISSQIASQCSCVDIVGIQIDPNDRGELKKTAESTGGSFCNVTNNNSEEIKKCLVKSIDFYRWNDDTKECRNAKGEKGYNKPLDLIAHEDTSNYSCTYFQNVNLSESPYNKINTSSGIFDGSIFSNSTISNKSFNQKNGIRNIDFISTRITNTSFNTPVKNFNFRYSDLENVRMSNTSGYIKFQSGYLNDFTLKNHGVRSDSYCTSLNINSTRLYNSSFKDVNFCDLHMQDLTPAGLTFQNTKSYKTFIKNVKIGNSDFIRNEFRNGQITDLEFKLSTVYITRFDEIKPLMNIHISSSKLDEFYIYDSKATELHLKNKNKSTIIIRNSEVIGQDFSKLSNLDLSIENSDVRGTKISNETRDLSSSHKISLHYSNCTSCLFEDINIEKLNIVNSNFSNFKVKDSTISNLKLENSQLEDMEFKQDFFKSLVIKDSTLSKIHMAKADRLSVEKLEIIDSKIKTSKLNGLSPSAGKIEGSNFFNSDITFSNLNNTKIINTTFDSLNMHGIELSYLKLSSVNFYNITDFGNNGLIGNISGFECHKCAFENIDFPKGLSNTKLTSSTFTDLTFSSKIITGSIVSNKFNDVMFEGVDFGNNVGLTLKNNIFNDSSFVKSTRFNKSNLRSNEFNSSLFKEVSFLDTILSGNIFKDTSLKNSYIKDTKFLKDKVIGSDLSNSKIMNSEFDKVDFTRTSFYMSKINNSKFHSTLIDKALNFNTIRGLDDVYANRVTLENLELKSVALEGLRLKNSVLSNIDFSGSNLSGLNLKSSNVLDSQFEDSKLTNSIIDEVSFDNTNFYNADFSNSKIDDFKFTGSNLTLAKGLNTVKWYSSKSNSIFEDTFLDDTDFSNTSLTHIKFVRTSLEYTLFNDTKLSNVTFDDVTFYDTEFYGAKLIGTNIINSDKSYALGLD